MKVLLFGIVFLVNSIAHTQYNNRGRSLFYDAFGAGGLAIGQEHFAAVKGSFIKPINLGYRPRLLPKYGFYNHCVYVSLEGSLLGLFAVWAAGGLNLGYCLGPVTIDNSITAFGIGASNNNSFGLVSYNPKLGVRVGPVWLKSGPSFLLTKEPLIDNYLKIGDFNMNFELLFIIPN